MSRNVESLNESLAVPPSSSAPVEGIFSIYFCQNAAH